MGFRNSPFSPPTGFDDPNEPRLDLAPLLDVIFLLLTFFALSIVLLVRAQILDVRLPDLGQGQSERSPARITVSVNRDGQIALDGTPVTLDRLAVEVTAAAALLPQTSPDESAADQPPRAPTVMLAIDTDAPSGQLLRVVQELRAAGVTNIGVLGESQGQSDARPRATPSLPQPGPQPDQ